MHVVFGRVVGGIDVVRQIESLPVDANSRPLQDAKITRCGELVRQPKGKIFIFSLLRFTTNFAYLI